MMGKRIGNVRRMARMAFGFVVDAVAWEIVDLARDLVRKTGEDAARRAWEGATEPGVTAVECPACGFGAAFEATRGKEGA